MTVRTRKTRAESDQAEKPLVTKSARARVMDLLARRNYSATELERKLNDDYSAEEISEALAFARESKWLLSNEELSERVAVTLHRKRKGHRFINQYLKAKGLPPIQRDPSTETEKAIVLVKSKLGKKLDLESPTKLDYENQKKVYRLLANRGFDEETIRRVIESFKA